MDPITSLFKYRPKKEYICKESGLPWLKLSIDVPVQDIYNEYKNCEDLIVKHRNNDKWANLTHTGWHSATLYGVSTQTTTASNEAHGWTDLAIQCPITVDCLLAVALFTAALAPLLPVPCSYITPSISQFNSHFQPFGAFHISS